MNDLLLYLKTGKRPRRLLSKAIIKYIENTLKHTFQAVELPVYVDKLQCATQIDLVTMSPSKQLYLWEIKTGFPNSRSYGMLNWWDELKNTKRNHFELQRYYCAVSLAEHVPLQMKNTHVLLAYHKTVKKGEKNVNSVEVNAMKKPPIVKKHLMK